jgi:hypothetical protein
MSDEMNEDIELPGTAINRGGPPMRSDLSASIECALGYHPRRGGAVAEAAAGACYDGRRAKPTAPRWIRAPASPLGGSVTNQPRPRGATRARRSPRK